MSRLSKAELEKLFPYETFPIRMEWKEGKNVRIAWFECHEHMQKQYDRVKKPRLKVDVRYRYPDLKPEEKPKRKVSASKVTKTKKPIAKKAETIKTPSVAKKTTTKAKAPVKRARRKKTNS